ncbi:hypothetical protein ASA1KI_22040 [Opitutales bacterium ASA1]|uniref:rhodanese-like domain-containing protein n=1 Tax=Congregicoccus parvus TaxID=3081749 RepID=UPI002B2F23CA|nr:hypothetical protein ASA1KI_22040 [Opitutales bacterium ASA1]
MSDPIFLTLLVAAVAFLGFKLYAARPRLSPRDAAREAASGRAEIVDVREPSEWSSGVAAPATLLPLSDLRGDRTLWNAFLQESRDKRLLVYCHSGMRSAHAAAMLRKEGFDAVNLGGFSAWQSAGLPVRKPGKT